MDKRLKDADVGYESGFLICRLVGVDESSGEAVTVPGVAARIRCSSVLVYVQAEPRVLDIYVEGQKKPFTVVGEAGTVDKLMKRDNVRVV